MLEECTYGIEMFQWQLLHHPPYNPDFAPSDYCLFGTLKLHLGDKQSMHGLCRWWLSSTWMAETVVKKTPPSRVGFARHRGAVHQGHKIKIFTLKIFSDTTQKHSFSYNDFCFQNTHSPIKKNSWFCQSVALGKLLGKLLSVYSQMCHKYTKCTAFKFIIETFCLSSNQLKNIRFYIRYISEKLLYQQLFLLFIQKKIFQQIYNSARTLNLNTDLYKWNLSLNWASVSKQSYKKLSQF